MGYASRDAADPSQIKKNKQSMADLKLRRLTELNNRLREDLERERIPVSQAARSIIAYTNTTRDFMVPSVWGPVDKKDDPYTPQPSGGCCVLGIKGLVMEEPKGLAAPAPYPRIVIKFCTKCKWMLRAAYFAQELLSTFSTDLGEVALQPATGGVFSIEIFYTTTPSSTTQAENGTVTSMSVQSQLLWDRDTEGGFPETREIKRRVRDIIDPNRDLGHVDGRKKAVASTAETPTPEAIKATTGLAGPTGLAVPTAHAGPAAPEVSLRDFIATGVATGDVNSSGRGGAEEEVLEHDELTLEAQPGGGRYKRPAAETGNMEEEVGIKGVVCDTAYDEKKRNLDGTICEDCS
ncbi:hypothetical protein V502_08362 [Pseudogymnoascus sp. VKM F-4520 (FW-2644)]|nr:hypothetical protein V502_08362 [Pseudogymnoascus sp. VKM F-4520 (FW-2644)]